MFSESELHTTTIEGTRNS